MGDILVGTCSWTDPALVRSGWYPSGQRDAERRLRYYAGRFPVVEAERTLEATARRTEGRPIAVEFRHPDRWRPERAAATRALLADHGMTAVAVDMLQGLPTSVPPVAPVTTSRLAVVRFHGRSASWGRGSKEDRFRYAYTDDEIAEWVPRLRELAERTERVHVLFNNCCADASVRAAERLDRLLRARQAPPSGS
ncbi:DUF72 domain-containing protein [Streptomyces sp. BYX5S]